MTRALAFTQFMIVSLGAFALHLLIKVGGPDNHPRLIEGLGQFLARHALWFFAIPLLYAASTSLFGGGVESLPLKIVGWVLCAILLALFGLPLFHYLY